MERKAHWESIYAAKATTEVSWYQERPAKSLELIHSTGLGFGASIIDVGGGASTLVDHLLGDGYSQLSVLEISMTALAKIKKRLGRKAEAVTFMDGDVTQVTLPANHYDLWHDRAVFHFLIEADDRRKYVEVLTHALKPGGHLIMATFALDGPPRCSGLDVVRYSPESLSAELGLKFRPVRSITETHHTPFATEQKFIYCLFQKTP